MKVARGNTLEVKRGQQVLDGFGFAQIGRQDCRREPDFLFAIASVPHARHSDRHCADPSHNLTFGQMAMAHQSSTTIVHSLRSIRLQQNRKFGLNSLLNQTLRAGSQEVRQRFG